jgi:hypothetical protein
MCIKEKKMSKELTTDTIIEILTAKGIRADRTYPQGSVPPKACDISLTGTVNLSTFVKQISFTVSCWCSTTDKEAEQYANEINDILKDFFYKSKDYGKYTLNSIIKHPPSATIQNAYFVNFSVKALTM